MSVIGPAAVVTTALKSTDRIINRAILLLFILFSSLQALLPVRLFIKYTILSITLPEIHSCKPPAISGWGL
jgi:hypothetical protein